MPKQCHQGPGEHPFSGKQSSCTCPAVHAYVSCASDKKVWEQLESEARVRLIAGLKKYYHAKQREGLLSGRGTQVLDWACSIAMDEPDRPLNVWQIVHRYALLAGSQAHV